MYDGHAVLANVQLAPGYKPGREHEREPAPETGHKPDREPGDRPARKPGPEPAPEPRREPGHEHKEERNLPITRKRCPGTCYSCEIAWRSPEPVWEHGREPDHEPGRGPGRESGEESKREPGSAYSLTTRRWIDVADQGNTSVAPLPGREPDEGREREHDE